jgi:hypothetical protein
MSGQADKKLAATTAAEIATIPTTYLGETDADKLKIYNENLLEKYSAGCQNGDKSACAAMKTVQVDYNNVSSLVGNVTTLGGSAGLCLVGGAETLGVACAPLIGEVTYTAINAGDNFGQGRPLLSGWSWLDATTTGAGTYVMASTDLTLPSVAGLGATVGFASDVISQEGKHPLTVPNLPHAVCAGAMGAGSAAAVFSKTVAGWMKGSAWGLLTGFDSNEVCNEVFGG